MLINAKVIVVISLLFLASEDINTVILEWDMFRVGSHVDRTEFQVISVDKQSCAKYLDIGNCKIV